MESLIVACIQQRMHLPQSRDEHKESLRRFLRIASNKSARLVVFPELGGLMVAPPMLGDFRSGLLKRADFGRRPKAGLWQRTLGQISAKLAAYLKADLRRNLAALLDVAPQEVWAAYAEVYGGLAREFGLTIVAPSGYLPDPLDGVVRNLAAVFGPDGSLLGVQAKVVLHPADAGIAQPGSAWDVIPTPAGRIGLILGGDVLYPEVGRLLAYQGADILLTAAACDDLAMYNKVRFGMLARMQDNQLFALCSFLVGRNVFGVGDQPPYAGKSAIFAPQELTPRRNGVLVEMGGPSSEGVVVAEWDFAALKQLWESSDTPVRRTLTTAQMSGVLSQIYARLQNLPAVAEPHLLAGPGVEAPTGPETVLALDDLTLLASITGRWPPTPPHSQVDGPPSAPEELEAGDAAEPPLSPEVAAKLAGGAPISAAETNADEPETDEMDSV